ncbi:MAG TPA: asparagine synthase-related protein [Polyangia bacterium]|nr:asparagine synthase-related protein [Polyangia bacterium]
MVGEFLTRKFRTLDRSFFRDIARIPPGHVLVGTESEIQTFDYRVIPANELAFSSAAECQEELRSRLFRAVERRLSSAKPSIVLLSGGVDSTSIACAADRLAVASHRMVDLARPIAAAAVHPGLECDESVYIDAVERYLRIPVFRWNGALADGVEFSEPLIGGPGNRVPWTGGTDGHLRIAEVHGAEVLLDGTGGDQVGMPLGTEHDEFTQSDWLRATSDVFGSAYSGRNLLRWTMGIAVPLSVMRAYRRVRQRLSSPPVVPSWLRSTISFRQQSTPADYRVFISESQRMRWQTLTAAPLAAAIDIKQRHSTWAGLQTTFPFLDWDVIQFVLAVPEKYWPRPGWLARFHREALRSDLPPAVYFRRSKAEFTPALVNRLRRGKPALSALLGSKRWAAGQFIDQSYARKLLDTFMNLQRPGFAAAYHLWSIAAVESWLRHIFDYHTAHQS